MTDDEDFVVPPLHLDPVAQRLGLIPDPEQPLRADALRVALDSIGMDHCELASRLIDRAWPCTDIKVRDWLNGATGDVSPALIRAIAEVLRTTSVMLTSTPPPSGLVEQR